MNNTQEIEAKFYVRDLDKITKRLHELEARLIQARVLEMNIRFDLFDDGPRLRSEGRVLRLRQDTAVRLTYKDSGKSEQGVLNRTEIEFTVENFEKAKLFLEALGYQKLFEYEKYRTTYALEPVDEQAHPLPRCHIMLDELPYGNFVEIEGESIAAIQDVAEKLELDWNTAIEASYSDLFERVRQALELTFADLTFANFDRILVSPAHLQVELADHSLARKRD